MGPEQSSSSSACPRPLQQGSTGTASPERRGPGEATLLTPGPPAWSLASPRVLWLLCRVCVSVPGHLSTWCWPWEAARPPPPSSLLLPLLPTCPSSWLSAPPTSPVTGFLSCSLQVVIRCGRWWQFCYRRASWDGREDPAPARGAAGKLLVEERAGAMATQALRRLGRGPRGLLSSRLWFEESAFSETDEVL